MIAKRIPGPRVLVTSIAVLLCTCFVTCTAAMGQGSAAQPQEFYWCRMDATVGGTTVVYVSKLFPSRDPSHSQASVDAAGRAWVSYILKTYSPQDSQDILSTRWSWGRKCMTSWPYGQAGLQQMHDSAVGGGAVEVNWQYTKDQDVAPAPIPYRQAGNGGTAPPAPAQNQATQFKKGYCVSSYKKTPIYFSDVFESNVPFNVDATETPRDIANLFDAYLKQTYGYTSSSDSPVVCVFVQNAVATEESKKQLEARYRGDNKQVAETGWKLSRQQAAALPIPTHNCGPHDATCQQSASPPVAPAGGGAPSATSSNSVASPKAPLFYCLTPGSPHREIYYSAATPKPTVKPGDLEMSFAAYLLKKYGFRTSPSCIEAQAGDYVDYVQVRKNQIANYRSDGYTIIETEWTYTPGSATPLPPVPTPPPAPAAHNPNNQPSAPPAPAKPSTAAKPAAPVVSGPPTNYGVCIADNGRDTVYFSAPFTVTNRAMFRWQQAFGEFLQKKYKYGGSIGCSSAGSLAEAQSYIKKLDDTLRPTKKIVDTAWEYK